MTYAALQLGASRVMPQVVFELPDLACAWKYQRWAAQQNSSDSIPVMVVAWDQFRGETSNEKRREAATPCLRSLMETGRPAPLFARVFNPY